MSLPRVDPPPFPPPYPPGNPRFGSGDAVRVRPGIAPGHIRTPWYLRGKTGVVERVCGAFGKPEELAYGRDGGRVPLYRVRFTMQEVWGGKASRPDDTIDAEIFEHWLEAADAP
ncbi:MAG: nitrile hydratase subunit beta [Paracoccaceae bacterium]|nr:nitrile hydratase subunit beta [Paracoccaceae bacterium]